MPFLSTFEVVSVAKPRDLFVFLYKTLPFFNTNGLEVCEPCDKLLSSIIIAPESVFQSASFLLECSANFSLTVSPIFPSLFKSVLNDLSQFNNSL